jgi:hypothetical protein
VLGLSYYYFGVGIVTISVGIDILIIIGSVNWNLGLYWTIIIQLFFVWLILVFLYYITVGYEVPNFVTFGILFSYFSAAILCLFFIALYFVGYAIFRYDFEFSDNFND